MNKLCNSKNNNGRKHLRFSTNIYINILIYVIIYLTLILKIRTNSLSGKKLKILTQIRK